MSSDVPDVPEAAASSWLAAGGSGGTMAWSFHVPYWGFTQTSEVWANATISLETRVALAVACWSSWMMVGVASASDATVWLVTS